MGVKRELGFARQGDSLNMKKERYWDLKETSQRGDKDCLRKQIGTMQGGGRKEIRVGAKHDTGEGSRCGGTG